MNRNSDHGFTLLEVMVALAIMALALAAIGSSHTATVMESQRVYHSTVATQLVRGVVLDIEEEYKIDEFPTNSLTARDCELPNPFDDDFECEYDLERIEFDEAELNSMVEAALSGFAGLQGPDGNVDVSNPQAISDAIGGNIGAMLLQGLLLQQQGFDFFAACGLDPQRVIQQAMSIGTFLPTIVQMASEQTRKLTIRLSWKVGRRDKKELSIETYIVAIPKEREELLKAAGTATDEQIESITGQKPLDSPNPGGQSPPKGR